MTTVKKDRNLFLPLAGILSLLLAGDALAAVMSYRVEPLGPAGLRPAYARINQRGEIVLGLEPLEISGAGVEKWLLIRPTETLDITHVLPQGALLNDHGELFGVVPAKGGAQQPRLWVNGSVTTFPYLMHPTFGIVAFNAERQFVGGMRNHGKWTAMQGSIVEENLSLLEDIGTLGGSTILVTDLSNTGIATGFDRTGATPEEILAGATTTEAFRYDGFTLQGLGTLGGASSLGFAVNDAGVVTGDSTTLAGESHAFLHYPDLGFLDIGTPGLDSVGLDINNLNQVVGREILSDGQFAGFLYDPMEGRFLLEELVAGYPGWQTLGQGMGINDRGQIVGIGVFEGQSRAFLMTPVPEPTSLATAVALGLALLGTASRQRRRLSVGS